MPYMPTELPAPNPTMDERPFWENCAKQRLTFQRCADCGHYRHPPTPVCGKCRSTRCEWGDAPEMGEVFTYTVVHHPSHEAVKPELAYNIAVVAFPELNGVRLVSNVIDAGPDDMRVGMKVRLVWEEHTAGVFLPRFRRA